MYSRAHPLGAWYDSWTDLWGDVQGVSSAIVRVGQGAKDVGNQGRIIANNAQNATNLRVNVSTLVWAGLGIAAVTVVPSLIRRRR